MPDAQSALRATASRSAARTRTDAARGLAAISSSLATSAPTAEADEVGYVHVPQLHHFRFYIELGFGQLGAQPFFLLGELGGRLLRRVDERGIEHDAGDAAFAEHVAIGAVGFFVGARLADVGTFCTSWLPEMW